MSFLRKIKKLLPLGKQQTFVEAKKNEIRGYFRSSPELKGKFPDIYASYERTILENELDEMRTILHNYRNRESIRKLYLQDFERNVRLQELYPQSYLQLQKEVSEEEWRVLKPTVDKQRKREWRKEKLLGRFDEDAILKKQYGDIYEQLLNVVLDEEVERYENVLQEYESRRKERNRWIEYLESFPKLKEKYAKEYELLHKDLSREEIRTVAVNISYEKNLLRCLNLQYDAYVKETIEANYAIGKVEKLYKGYIDHEELMSKYPKETEALIKHYGPEFDKIFFEKNGNPKYTDVWVLLDEKKEFLFKDMSYFREFIERNHVLSQYVITDREYTAISDKLRSYVPVGAIRDIAGTYIGYSISYENFLVVKKLYPEEVAFYASKEVGVEDIVCFIHKVHPYLTQHRVEYVV